MNAPQASHPVPASHHVALAPSRIRVERAVAEGSTLDAPIYAPGWVVLDPDPLDYLTDTCIHDEWAVAIDCAYWRARLR